MKNTYRIGLVACITFFILSCTSNKKVTDTAYIKNIEDHRDSITLEKSKDQRLAMGKQDLSNIMYFAPDASYQITCDVTYANAEELKEVDTYAKKKKQLKPYAYIHGKMSNKSFKLTAYQYFFGGKIIEEVLFIPLMDATTGETTYGGGRYLDLPTSSIQNDKVVLDFNKLYNPLCAYRDGYNCIVPPVENHLDIEINAGEKKYVGSR